jgi:hypothetical protein
VKFPSVLLVVGVVGAAGIFACQTIAGLQSRTANPPPGPGCTLPTTGAGSIRLVNVATEANNGVPTATDFCVRVSGTSNWGVPILANGGTDYDAGTSGAAQLCTGGLGYGLATVPFSVDIGAKVASGGTGSIDIKAIPAGSFSKGCGAAATSELDGITVGDHTGTPPANPVVTIIRYGGGESSPETIVALPEETGAQSASNNHVRVVNALNGTGGVNFGFTVGTSLPTSLTPASGVIQPGAVIPQGPTPVGTVDANGYVPLVLGPVAYGFSNATDKTNAAFAVFTTNQVIAQTGSLYAIGDPLATNQSTFPLRGLFCNDTINQACGSDAGGGCDAGTTGAEAPLFAQCSLTQFSAISVDSFDLGLYGTNAPFSDQRVKGLETAIAARTLTDIMCLTEVDDQGARTDIAKLAGTFPAPFKYSYMADTTVATPPTNPVTQAGTTPPKVTAPPCNGVDAGTVQAAYNCTAANCSVNGTSFDGGLKGGTSCIESACALPFLKLLNIDPATPSAIADDLCYDCMVWNLVDPNETIAQSQTTCMDASAPAFLYEGQMPLLILSRFPLSGTKFYAYPSTGLRRGALKAQVQLQAGQTIDFFCTQLVSSQIDSTSPYVGNYGKDTASCTPGPGAPTCTTAGTAENGWYDEQLYQAQQLVAWVKSEVKNDGVPAIIAGQYYSSIANTPPANATPDEILGTLDPLTMGTLDNTVIAVDGGAPGAFQRAEPNNYVRLCDQCPDNPWTEGEVAYEFGPLFLYNYPNASTATTSETLWANATASYIPITSEGVETAPKSGLGPLSTYYAHNWILVRPTQ